MRRSKDGRCVKLAPVVGSAGKPSVVGAGAEATAAAICAGAEAAMWAGRASTAALTALSVLSPGLNKSLAVVRAMERTL